MNNRGLAVGLLLLSILAAIGFVGAAHVQDLNLDCVKPVYIIAADLNRDAYPDLAVACHSCNTVLVIPNLGRQDEGCSQFKDAVAWKLNDSPVAIASGYFIDPPTGTSKQSFPFADMFPNVVVVTQYLPGVGRFCPLTKASAPGYLALQGGNLSLNALTTKFATLTHLALGDFDNDGALDVAVLDGLTPKIGIYAGTRSTPAPAVPNNGSVETGPDVVIPLTANRAYFISTGDFDRDGLLDIVVAADGRLFFYRNLTEGTGAIEFTSSPAQSIVLGTKVVGVAVADFNRDGYLDLAAVDPDFGALSIVLNRGCWSFELFDRIKKDGQPVFVVPLDCDRNGLIDLAVAEYATNRVEIVLNRLACKEKVERPDLCDYTTAPPAEEIDKIEFFRSHSYEVGPGPIGLTVADFDLNGIPDIAVALHGGDGTTAPPPEVQVIYNPCCCSDCDLNKSCCDTADSERDVCPELVGASPKG